MWFLLINKLVECLEEGIKARFKSPKQLALFFTRYDGNKKNNNNKKLPGSIDDQVRTHLLREN